MKEEPFIGLENVSLDFPLERGRKAHPPNEAHGSGRIEGNVKHALREISFEARPGDRIGLVGMNGAGKTTLLRLINGVYNPSGGRMIRQGRVGSLINVTLGMDLAATGYENIVIRARERECSLTEAYAVAEEIADFSELGENMHQPMRTYSSGMTARFAFALATSFHADILLMDEWLSAGDARFHEKALVRMQTFLRDDRVLVLASHSDGMIRDWCNKVIVLHEGRQITFADVFSGLRLKREIMSGGYDPITDTRLRQAFRALDLPAPSRSDAWCAGGAGEPAKSKPVPGSVKLPASDGEPVRVVGDFGSVAPRGLIRLEAGERYKVAATFRQKKHPHNGRPAGIFVGFILLDNNYGLTGDPYRLDRLADNLRTQHGEVRAESIYQHKEGSDAAYARPYFGANYSGSAPHADGEAEISDFSASVGRVISGELLEAATRPPIERRAPLRQNDFTDQLFHRPEQASTPRLDTVAMRPDGVFEVSKGYGFIAQREWVRADRPLLVTVRARQINSGSNGRPAGLFVGVVGLDEGGRRVAQPFRFEVVAENLQPGSGVTDGRYRYQPSPEIAYVRAYAGVNYSRGAPHCDGTAIIEGLSLESAADER